MDQFTTQATPEQITQIRQKIESVAKMYTDKTGKALELTDAQKTQIQSIMAANKPSAEAREEMRTLMMAHRTGTLTTAQQERFEAIRTQRQEKGRAVHEQIMGVLTAEQKAKIETRKQEMRQRMEERKANRGLRQTKPVETVKTPKTN